MTTSRTRRPTRLAAAAVGLLLPATLAACGSESSPQQTGSTPTASSTQAPVTGLGEAAVALLVAPAGQPGAPADEGGLLLVDRDGSFRSEPVTALPGALPRLTATGIEVVGAEKDLVVGTGAVQRHPASGAGETVLAQVSTPAHDWTFLDQGGIVTASATPVTAGTKKAPTGRFFTPVQGLVPCGKDVLGILADDEMAAATSTVKVIRYRVRGQQVVGTTTRVNSPGLVRDARVACLSGKPVVLAADDSGPLVAKASGGAWTWHEVDSRSAPETWGTVIGQTRNEVVLASPVGVVTLDLTSLEPQRQYSWLEGSGASASMTDSTLAIWDPSKDELTLQHYPGDVRTTIDAGPVLEHLEETGFEVVGAPVALPGGDTP